MQRTSRRLGVILLFGTLGMALGGWLAGYLFDSTGSYTPAFLVGAAFNVTNVIVVLGLIRRIRAGACLPRAAQDAASPASRLLSTFSKR